jgi:hypothetical protein
MSVNIFDCRVLNERRVTLKGDKRKKSFEGFQKQLTMERLTTGY